MNDDNVIYANFGARKRVDTPEASNHEPAPTLAGPAERVYSMLKTHTEAGRFQRGVEYFRNGHVVDLEIRNGVIAGSVAGSQNQPFEVQIRLPYRSTDDITEVPRRLTRQTGALSAARDGKLDSDVYDLLFASDGSEITFHCDCPDNSVICKHAVATAQKFISQLESDPTVIFRVRGMDFQRLEELVIDFAQHVADEATEEGAETFWTGRELPAVPRPQAAPALDDSDPDKLRKALRAVSHTNIDLLRAVSDIEDMYYHLTRSGR